MSGLGSKDAGGWPDIAANTTTRALYDEDEFGWMLQQADLLRAGRLDEIDRHALAEHLTDMARSKQAALRSMMIVLLQHMLKVTTQPERVTRSWLLTINVQRREITFLRQEEPGMRQYIPGLYAQALREALTVPLPEPTPRGRKVKRS